MITAELIEKLEKLSPELQKQVEKTIDQLLVEKVNPDDTLAEKPKLKREFGGLKGLIWMSDDFDEPLEDFKDYI